MFAHIRGDTLCNAPSNGVTSRHATWQQAALARSLARTVAKRPVGDDVAAELGDIREQSPSGFLDGGWRQK